MVKLAVIVPTFGEPDPKLICTLDHIRKAVPEDTPILVHDDATPWEDVVAKQCQICLDSRKK